MKASGTNTVLGRQLAEPTAPLKIARVYQQRTMPVDALLDVLQALLLGDPPPAEGPSFPGAEPTCFPIEPE